jgi:hypothetical protein
MPCYAASLPQILLSIRNLGLFLVVVEILGTFWKDVTPEFCWVHHYSSFLLLPLKAFFLGASGRFMAALHYFRVPGGTA